MKNYEINEDTMAIIPLSYYETLIKETNREFKIAKNTYKVMEESCEYYGSTYSGRVKAAKKILDCSYKLPLIIEESENIVFFPTKSATDENCSWLNANHIKKIVKVGNKSEVIFNNDQKIIIDVSRLSLNNQVSRAFRLETILRKRLMSLKKTID